MDISRNERQFHLTDLREYTEYSFYVSAFNDNGEGGYSDEITCRTYSDIPADPPQNVTVEPASSSSVIGRSLGKIFFTVSTIFLARYLKYFSCFSSVGATSEGVSERCLDWLQAQVEEEWEGFWWEGWDTDSVD